MVAISLRSREQNRHIDDHGPLGHRRPVDHIVIPTEDPLHHIFYELASLNGSFDSAFDLCPVDAVCPYAGGCLIKFISCTLAWLWGVRVMVVFREEVEPVQIQITELVLLDSEVRSLEVGVFAADGVDGGRVRVRAEGDVGEVCEVIANGAFLGSVG